MESLAAVTGSFLLIIAGLELGLQSLREIFFVQRSDEVENMPAAFTLVVLGVTIALKEGLSAGFITVARGSKARLCRLTHGIIAPMR